MIPDNILHTPPVLTPDSNTPADNNKLVEVRNKKKLKEKIKF